MRQVISHCRTNSSISPNASTCVSFQVWHKPLLKARRGGKAQRALSHPTSRSPVWPCLVSPLQNGHPAFCTLLPIIFPPDPELPQATRQTTFLCTERREEQVWFLPPQPPWSVLISGELVLLHNPQRFTFTMVITQIQATTPSFFDIRFITVNSRTLNCFF